MIIFIHTYRDLRYKNQITIFFVEKCIFEFICKVVHQVIHIIVDKCA